MYLYRSLMLIAFLLSGLFSCSNETTTSREMVPSVNVGSLTTFADHSTAETNLFNYLNKKRVDQPVIQTETENGVEKTLYKIDVATVEVLGKPEVKKAKVTLLIQKRQELQDRAFFMLGGFLRSYCDINDSSKLDSLLFDHIAPHYNERASIDKTVSANRCNIKVKAISGNDPHIYLEFYASDKLIQQDYIKSTLPIMFSESERGIYYKELLKNPSKFNKTKTNVTGRIMNIEERDGLTAFQMYITRDYDSVIVYYKGTVNAYKDDLVTVYGELGGTIDGKNAFGAGLTLPVLTAKYVVKTKREIGRQN